MDTLPPPPPRVLLIGAEGTLGRAVAAELAPRHDLLSAGRTSGELRLDLTDVDSMREALAQAGPLDAVVCAAGNVHFAPLLQMTAENWQLGLTDKLMGQVSLSLLAAEYLRDGGSITL
jgi:NAD(P)-dependent dehydrogenase (short-subunit alcohol dehydrogenase family)